MDGVNEDLLRFLDADDYEEKLQILEEIKGRVDDHVVNMMAASLSLARGSASKESCIDQIRDYLTLQIQYDGKRMRQ
ncbi:MAG: hypothetical protein K6E90_02275 [Lachnospiraceae bacterium]|nr:hypothetical protein [Lachnospiraceae bacterium]MCR5409785.1 hypothetical protein [Lachnospiraceae bacterium]